MVPLGSQEYCGVGRGLSGLPWGQCNGRGPHLELRQEPRGFSPVLMWVSGCVFHFKQGVRSRRVWRHGTLLSSQAVKGVSGLRRVEFGSEALFELATGASELRSCCELILALHSNQFKGIKPDFQWMGKYVAFEFGQDPQAPLQCQVYSSLLSTCN